MATLNIKNFPDDLYEGLRRRAARERRSIAQEVLHLLGDALAEELRPSLLELDGLGHDVWGGIDAGKHVDAERASWE